MKNNLFQYATKELSQDALLCWLANWYNYDGPLKTLSEDFIRMIVSRNKKTAFDIKKVTVLRQYNHIDVLLIVNDSLGIIIEDKTSSCEHDNQITRYAEQLFNSPVIMADDSVHIEEIICVYYKTAEYVKEDDAVSQKNEIVKITRKDMLALIKPYIEKSEILLDYYEYLKSIDNTYNAIEEHYNHFEYNEAMKHSHMQWRFFKDYFAETNTDGMRIFPFASLLPEGQDPIEQGTSFGVPYTWYWFVEFSSNVEKEKLLEKGRYLGYRIDADAKGAFISLRMYCRYNKANDEEKALQQKHCLRLRNYISAIISEKYPDTSENNFVIHYNNSGRTTNYECEIFKCYFSENVFDEESNADFIKMLHIFRGRLQLFA